MGASGLASIEDNIPLEPGDRFEIGSITKTFTATVVLQLVEENILSLEDTITDWLPESVTANILNADEINIEQLLQHTSGIPNYVEVLFEEAASNPLVFTRDWEPEELVELIAGQEALFEPGASFTYSNTNFLLAGMIIEAATDNNIAAEIRARIIEPLGLDNTFFAEEEAIPGDYVSGYWDFDQDGTLDNINLANLSWAWSTGAIVSNVEDLDTFARNLFAGDLLQPETLAQMLDTIPATDNENYSSYGLGVGTIESPNRFWYIHRGQTLGYRSNLWYSPQDDLTYIELINGFSDDNLVRDILPTYRIGVSDDTLEFTITEQNSSIAIPVLDDALAEGTEIVSFTLESGAGYEISPDSSSGEFTITDSSALGSPGEIISNLGFGIFPEVVNEGENITFFFEAPGLIPDDGSGFVLYLDSEIPNSLSRFDLDGAMGGDSLVANADNSGFAVRIFEDGATLEIPVIVDQTTQEPVEVTYELVTRENISAADLSAISSVTEIDDYELNLQMFISTVTITDNFVVEPTEPEEPVSDSLLEPIIGSLEGDLIEVNGESQLIFTGDSDDFIDISTGSSNNRVYAGDGNDSLILGTGDRIFTGDGDDAIFTTSGGDNTITGGAGSDQFWLASAEIPESVNTITDFTLGEDIIGVAGLNISFADIVITNLTGDTLISINNSDLAILQNVSADSLTSNDFTFL
ncbi:MAG: serine hydrolase [Cyanobacteria bacterium J06558_2]